MSTLTVLPVPPAFDYREWKNDPSVKTPALYHGSQFDFSTICQFIQADDEASTVTILGKTAPAMNLQIDIPERELNYPFYFEVEGVVYSYLFSIWADRVAIQVRRHANSPQNADTLLSTMFPSTEAELLRALQTIVDDLP